MNCQSARKFLYAFADGQLGVTDNCEVLDHLKMCPSCSSVVTEHQSIRSVLAKFVDRVPVPASLESKVRTRLSLRLTSKPMSVAARFSWLRVGAVAACVLLAAGAGSWLWWSVDDDIDSQIAQFAHSAPPVKRIQAGTSAASNVSAVHHKCTDLGPAHQCPSLPSKLDGLDKALAAQLGNRIKALAPDLSRFGFHFESVGLCGVKDGGDQKGGHLVYASADGSRRLSFLSIPRLDSLDPSGPPSMNSETPVYYGIAQDVGDDLIIAAWHRDITTYACCAQLEPLKVEQIVNSVRTDLVAFSNHMILAGIWPMK